MAEVKQKDFSNCRWTENFKLISVYDGLRQYFKIDKPKSNFMFNTRLVSLLSPLGIVNRTKQRILLRHNYTSLEWVRFVQRTIQNKNGIPCVDFEDFKKIITILILNGTAATPIETKPIKNKRKRESDVLDISKKNYKEKTTEDHQEDHQIKEKEEDQRKKEKEQKLQNLELQIKLQKIQLKIKREETKMKQEETKILMYRLQYTENLAKPELQPIRNNPLTNNKLAEIWVKSFHTDFFGLCQVCKTNKVNPIGLKIHKIKEAQDHQQLLDPSNLILSCSSCSRNSSLYLINKQNKYQRALIWLNVNSTRYTSKCFCCRQADISYYGNWHAGHVVPHSLGGTTDLINMRTICIDCNLNMNSENMNEYMIRNNYDKIPHVGDLSVDRKTIQCLYEELKRCVVVS